MHNFIFSLETVFLLVFLGFGQIILSLLISRKSAGGAEFYMFIIDIIAIFVLIKLTKKAIKAWKTAPADELIFTKNIKKNLDKKTQNNK
jgi:hypothetical protein